MRFIDNVYKVTSNLGGMWRIFDIVTILFTFYWKSLPFSSAWGPEKNQDSGQIGFILMITLLIHFSYFFALLMSLAFLRLNLCYQLTLISPFFVFSFSSFETIWNKVAELVRPSSYRQALFGNQKSSLAFAKLSSSGLFVLYMSAIKCIVRQINKCITLTLRWVKT